MIKNWYLKNTLTFIEKHYKNFDQKKKPIIEYGLEALYLSITKLIPIILISILLGLFKEMLYFMFAYNILRLFGFGLHATKSYICFISSTITFILIPYLCRIIEINIYIKIFICLFCFISFVLYAPSDTKKRPIVSKKRRLLYKVLATSLLASYIIIVFITSNILINNILIFSMLTETFMIHPFSYKMFNMPYNNYIEYKKKKILFK